MPKMKTKRAAKKRLRKTASGQRNRGWKRHMLEAKSPKRRRRLRKGTLVAKVDEPRLKALVPYL
jgi:large subunit ribosomal protein L35